MFYANTVRGMTLLAGMAAIGMMGVGCTSQPGATPQAASPVGGAQALAAGTTLNVGQGTYIVPALPPSATETGYALTGEETSAWQQPDGRWISGTNGQVFVPAVP